MTSLLGYPLTEARALAEAAGYSVTVTELTCRKGRAGEDCRVIRERFPAEGQLELTYAAFTTDCTPGREG